MRKLLLFEIITFIWAIVILWLSLFYQPTGLVGDGSGFFLHLGAYFLLAFLAMHAYDHKKHLWPVVIIAISFGTAIEILQLFFGRVASVTDAIANIVGVVTAAVLIQNIEILAERKRSAGHRKG